MMSNGETGSGRLRITWAIAVKDIGDALKNKTILTVMLGVAMMMVTSQALPLLLKLRPVPKAVVYDPGKSGLIDNLMGSREFSLRRLPSLEEAELWVAEAGEVILGLILPPDFEERMGDGNPVVLEGFVVHWAETQKVSELEEFFQDQINQAAGHPVSIEVRDLAVYPQPDSGGRPFMVSMVFVITTLTVGAFLVPYLMIEEKEMHTIDSLLVSPARYSEVVIGKAVAGTVYCLAALAVVFFFNQAIINLWGLALLVAVIGALFSVAIGLLMGTLFENSASLNLWLGLIIILLFIPIFLAGTMGSSIPQGIRGVLPWLPSVALADLFRTSCSNDLSLAKTLPKLGDILAFSAILLALVVSQVRQMDK